MTHNATLAIPAIRQPEDTRAMPALPKVMHIDFWHTMHDQSSSFVTVMQTLAHHLPGYQPLLVGSGQVRQRYVQNGLDCVDIGESRLKNRIFNKILGLGVFTYQELINLIEQERPAILHFHSRDDLVAPILARLSYRPGSVFQYHYHFDHIHVARELDLVLCVSHDLAAHVRRHSTIAPTIQVLPNPLPTWIAGKTTAAWSGISEPARVLYAGGGYDYKGVQEMLQAAHAVAAQRGVHFEFCGVDMERFTAQDARISISGYLPPEQLLTRIAAADLVVMPSRREAFGLLALETMHLRRPLVTSDAGGLPEIADAEVSFPIASTQLDRLGEHLCAVLDTLAQSPSAVQERLERAYQRTLHYLPEALGQRLASLYDELLRTKTMSSD